MNIQKLLLDTITYDTYIHQLFESAIIDKNYRLADIYLDVHGFLHAHCNDLLDILLNGGAYDDQGVDLFPPSPDDILSN